MYLSTTDYVQHKHAPGTPRPTRFYAMLDRYLARLDALGAVIALTADHGMNAKTDGSSESERDLPAGPARRLARARAGARDPADHRSLRRAPRRARLVRDRLSPGRPRLRMSPRGCAALPGIEVVLTRDEAAARFELPADRIGDLVVVSERSVVLGTSRERHDLSRLDAAAALARRHLRAAGAADRSTGRSRTSIRTVAGATSTSSTSRSITPQ